SIAAHPSPTSFFQKPASCAVSSAIILRTKVAGQLSARKRLAASRSISCSSENPKSNFSFLRLVSGARWAGTQIFSYHQRFRPCKRARRRPIIGEAGAHMVSGSNDHKAVVREEFTRQAEAYAEAAPIKDPERLKRLVEAVNPRSDARVLEVATGPGHVTMAFAAVCREVVGLDLTDAPIGIANRARRERGLDNVRFEVGAAEHL